MPQLFFPASFGSGPCSSSDPTLSPPVAPACLRGGARCAPVLVFYSKAEADRLPGSCYVVLAANAAVGRSLAALYFFAARTGVLTPTDRRRAVAFALRTASSVSVDRRAGTVLVLNTPASLQRGHDMPRLV